MSLPKLMKLVARAIGTTVFTLAATLFAASQSAAPQTGPAVGTAIGSGAEVSFQIERPGLAVPKFTIQVREDGSGRYQAEQTERPATLTSMRGEAAQHIDRTLVLSAATTAKIFKAAHELNDFNMDCTSKAKNVADMGKKTLSYAGADGHGSCVYHYSENKSVGMLTDTFLAIAYTMDEGRKLEFLHRYDRLGLDEEMITLSQQVEDGRALELGTISQTLAALADDMAVLQRVRTRATKMLDQSK
jgi:hypothetical protein